MYIHVHPNTHKHTQMPRHHFSPCLQCCRIACIYISACIYIYIYIYIQTHTYTHRCRGTTSRPACRVAGWHAYIYVCLYVYMYIFSYTYKHTQNPHRCRGTTSRTACRVAGYHAVWAYSIRSWFAVLAHWASGKCRTCSVPRARDVACSVQ